MAIRFFVRECADCPFNTYTGGITECMHPDGKRGLMAPEHGRRLPCPLDEGNVIVMLAKGNYER